MRQASLEAPELNPYSSSGVKGHPRTALGKQPWWPPLLTATAIASSNRAHGAGEVGEVS